MRMEEDDETSNQGIGVPGRSGSWTNGDHYETIVISSSTEDVSSDLEEGEIRSPPRCKNFSDMPNVRGKMYLTANRVSRRCKSNRHTRADGRIHKRRSNRCKHQRGEKHKNRARRIIETVDNYGKACVENAHIKVPTDNEDSILKTNKVTTSRGDVPNNGDENSAPQDSTLKPNILLPAIRFADSLKMKREPLDDIESKMQVELLTRHNQGLELISKGLESLLASTIEAVSVFQEIAGTLQQIINDDILDD